MRKGPVGRPWRSWILRRRTEAFWTPSWTEQLHAWVLIQDPIPDALPLALHTLDPVPDPRVPITNSHPPNMFRTSGHVFHPLLEQRLPLQTLVRAACFANGASQLGNRPFGSVC